MTKKTKVHLLVILGILVFLWVIRAPLIATWVAHKTNLPIFIEGVHLGWSETDLYKLKIANPWRFKTRNALTARTTKITYQLPQLRSDPIVFQEIVMDQVYLGIEILKGDEKNNNWAAIGKRIVKQVNQKSKGVQIQQLVLTNVTVEVKGSADLAGIRKIDRIELSNIDSEHGFPTQSAIEQIFQESGVAEFVEVIFSPEIEILQFPFRLFMGPK